MILIFVIGIQPPNDWALYITVGFFVLTAIVWFAFEKRRFQGPPIGEMIAKRARRRSGGRAAVGETQWPTPAAGPSPERRAIFRLPAGGFR